MSIEWKPDRAPDSTDFLRHLSPDKVLYFFDHSVIFTTKGYLGDLLCYFSDEDEDEAIRQFIVSPISKFNIKRLAAGQIALRSALVGSWLWLAEVAPNFEVKAAWAVSPEEVPEFLLPPKGTGLYREHGIVERDNSADDALLSLKYTGGSSDGTIPMSEFKRLIDSIYQSFDKIFLPAISRNSGGVSDKAMRKFLNLPMYEPKLNSLLIRVRRPGLDVPADLSKGHINRKRTTEDMLIAAETFLESANSIASAKTIKDIIGNKNLDRVDTLGILADLAPDKSDIFNGLNIEGKVKSAQTNLTITRSQSEKIRAAYKEVVTGHRQIVGEVVDVNIRSGTFIIRTDSMREVTCDPKAGVEE